MALVPATPLAMRLGVVKMPPEATAATRWLPSDDDATDAHVALVGAAVSSVQVTPESAEM